jgi:hypothetical protein
MIAIFDRKLPPQTERLAEPLRPHPCGDGGIYIYTYIRGDGESVTKMLDESIVFAVG